MDDQIAETESFDKPAYKCKKCGKTEFQSLGYDRFKTHVEECDGYNNRHHRFVKGQLVQLSNYGRRSLGQNKQGTYKVIGFPKGMKDHCIEVMPVDYGNAKTFAHIYLKPIETTTSQAVKLEVKRRLL